MAGQGDDLFMPPQSQRRLCLAGGVIGTPGQVVYVTARKGPAATLRQALTLFREQTLRREEVIVELGCMRQPMDHPLTENQHDCCQDGHSTAWFAASGIDAYSVDIVPAHCRIAAACIDAQFPGHRVAIHCLDGIAFLKDFRAHSDRCIGLLYLDAWDADLPESASKHLEAFLAAEQHLTASNALVLVDDTDVRWDPVCGGFFSCGLGGKGDRLIPYLAKQGYRVLFAGRQTLLIKE
jgi:hypothetical protein